MFCVVQKGCQALDMTVVLQLREIPIKMLFDKVRPLNEDNSDMSYYTFSNCLTCWNMDRLMNTAYPVEKVRDIWQVERVLTFDLACRYVYHPVDCRSTSCSNLYPVEAYPGGEKSFARLRKKVRFEYYPTALSLCFFHLSPAVPICGCLSKGLSCGSKIGFRGLLYRVALNRQPQIGTAGVR